MSLSTKSCEDESLNDSWVDLSVGEHQRRATPVSSLINSSKLEKLLREAQRESNQSSLRGSAISSRESPKTPCSPKSPCTPPLDGHLVGDILHPVVVPCRRQGSTDWIWDWSSRPDQSPPKEWKLQHGKQSMKSSLSFRKSKVVKSGLFSSEMLSVLIITNVLSIVVGTGIGLYVSRNLGSSVFI